MNVPAWAPLSHINGAAPAGAPAGEAAHALVEHLPVAVVTLDAGARVQYANAGAEKLLGKPRAALAGRVFTSEEVLADDRWKMTSALHAVQGGEAAVLALRLGPDEKRARPVEAHLLPGLGRGETIAYLLDLTGQREVESALQQSETLYNTFLEQGPVGLIHLDARGTVTFENHRFRQIVGERPEDAWSGLSAFRIPGLDVLFAGAVKRLLSAQTVQDFSVRFAPPGRAPLHLLLNGSPIRREDGSVGGAMLMVQDVTEERARAEEQALRERFSRAEAALREAVLGGTDEAAFLREAARIFAQTTGADRAAVLVAEWGNAHRLAARAAWGEQAAARLRFHLDLAADAEIEAHVQSGLSVGLPPEADVPTRLLVPFFAGTLPEGALLLERFDSEPLLKSTNERLIAGLARLFETLWSWLQTTNRYRLTVATIRDALVNFLFEDDGRRRFFFVSDQMARITGQPPAAFVDEGAWEALPFDSAADQVLREHEARLRAGRPSEATFRIRHADGTPRWVREHAVPHRDDTGLLSVVGVVGDVTEQKRAEAILLDAKTAAETASRDKTSFIATLSHEIRTPLGTVNGFADLLARELKDYEAQTGTPLPPQIDEFVGTIRDRTGQILGLVSDIFDLANVEGGRVALAPAAVDVNGLVEEVAGAYRAALAAKGVALHLDLDAARPVAQADAARLRQIVDHLVQNAVKFTAEGAVGLRTRVRSGAVSLAVEDTGVGIGEAFQERLFTPFLQEDQRLNRDFSGVGIGLALVKRLVDLLGGRIEVTSKRGVGTTFRVLLPLG